MKIKKGDTVRVLRGRDRGKTGRVIRAWPATGRVIVEGAQLVYKHMRPKRSGEKGQRLQVASTLPISNVQFICPNCKRGTRLGIIRNRDQRQRQCKQCQAIID